MDKWLLAALAALASFIPGLTRQGLPFVPAVIDPFERGGLDIFAQRAVDVGPGSAAGPLAAVTAGGRFGVRRRRRRRQALTQGDRNAIAFIAATISKAAAGSFAVQLVTRSR